MLKSRFILLIFLLPFFLVSCSSFTSNQVTPLTESEYAKLLHYARNIIARLPKQKLLNSEKKFIQNTQPEKKIVYDGNKTGKVILTWYFNNGKEVKYISEGNLMDFTKSFESINISNVKVSSSYNKLK